MATQPEGHPVVRGFQRSAEAMKQNPELPPSQACAICGWPLAFKRPSSAGQASQSEHGGVCARCLRDIEGRAV